MVALARLQRFYLSSEVVVKNRSSEEKKRKEYVALAADIDVMIAVYQVMSAKWRLLAR